MAAVRVSGPLEPFKDGFWRALEPQGYSPQRVGLHLRLVAHLSRWLDERDLCERDLSRVVVEEFFAARRARYSWFKTPRSLAPLGGYLSSIGVVPVDSSEHAPACPADELVEAFRRYLAGERGLAAGSVELYVSQVRRSCGCGGPAATSTSTSWTRRASSHSFAGRSLG